MIEKTGARRRAAAVRVVFTLLTLGVAALPACNCGGVTGGGGTIPCATDQDCPPPLTCDEGLGVCRSPGDGGVYQCNPPLVGCPCQDGLPQIGCIGPGGDPTIIGSCEEGQSTCNMGIYGECVVVPDLNCEGVAVGSGGFDPTDLNSDQVTTGPEGELLLEPGVNQVSFGYLWIANTSENTVSKLDIETGKEVARYASVTGSNNLGVPGVPIGGVNGDPGNCANCPSRTAIDFKGDAFVANRAFGLQATVTKFANTTNDCADKNGNGVIDTSADVNNDGRIDVDDPGEFLAESDECILWTVPVGGNDGVARALAIDAGDIDGQNGNVWVGLYNERRVVQISGETGAPIAGGTVTLNDGTNDLRPYGAAVDGGGNVWVTGIYEAGEPIYLAKIDTVTKTLLALYPVPDDADGCSEAYGITIDVDQRIWLGGWECRDAKRFDPQTQQWVRVDKNGESNTRGIAADLDGNVWVAYTDGRVGKYKIADVAAMGDNAPGTMYDLPPLPGGIISSTIGVGIDRNGACWAVSRNDADPVGTATRIKPDGTIDSFPVGNDPYTYSDFTGFGLLTVVRPSGFWRGNIKGCAMAGALTDWKTLAWGEIEPAGTSVKMRVRVADTVAALDSAGWFGTFDVPAPPVDLDAAGVPDSVYMQVEVQLSTTDPSVTPAFTGFQVTFDCPGVDPIP